MSSAKGPNSIGAPDRGKAAKASELEHKRVDALDTNAKLEQKTEQKLTKNEI